MQTVWVVLICLAGGQLASATLCKTYGTIPGIPGSPGQPGTNGRDGKNGPKGEQGKEEAMGMENTITESRKRWCQAHGWGKAIRQKSLYNRFFEVLSGLGDTQVTR